MSADHETITKAQMQMQRCALDLEKLAADVADAKVIKEFNSDRLKRAFSASVAEFLASGDSATAAEHKSRASKAYAVALMDLQEQYKAAMRVIEQHDALKTKFESSRSILSCERAKLGLI
jgi:hypothetical protein